MNSSQLSKEQMRIIHAALKVKKRDAVSDKRIKTRLLETSHSKEFEEARTEWIFTSTFLFEQDYGEFSSQCDLCHAVGLKVNFVVYNDQTETSLRVGTSCIQNFLLLNGVKSQADSQRLFRSQVDESMKLPGLRLAYKECLTNTPYRRNVANFTKLLKEYLEDKGYRYPVLHDNIDHIVGWLYEPDKKFLSLPRFDLKRLSDLLHEQSNIEMISEKIAKDSFKPPMWQKRSHSVKTTLSDSEAYKTDRIAGNKRNKA